MVLFLALLLALYPWQSLWHSPKGTLTGTLTSLFTGTFIMALSSVLSLTLSQPKLPTFSICHCLRGTMTLSQSQFQSLFLSLTMSLPLCHSPHGTIPGTLQPATTGQLDPLAHFAFAPVPANGSRQS